MDAGPPTYTTANGDDTAPLSALTSAVLPRRDATAIEPRPRARAHGSRLAKIAVVAADAIAIVAAMAIAGLIRSIPRSSPEAVGPLWFTASLAIPVWLGVFARYKLYSAAAVTSVTAEVSRILHAVTAATACTGLVAILVAARISRAWLLLTLVCAIVTVTIERACVRQVFRWARTHGKLSRRILIIGTNAEASDVVQMLGTQAALGYEVVGMLSCGTVDGVAAPLPVLGHWSDAIDVVRTRDATGVIIATSAIDMVVANHLARDLVELGYHVELTSGLVDISADRLIARPLGRRPVMYVQPVRHFGWRAVAKRIFDVVIATGLLVLSAPVLLVAAIAIKLDSPGPVLFMQTRVGQDGNLFRVRKLRTMVISAELMLDVLHAQSDINGPLFKMYRDPRVTRTGRFLRKYSIDELPQFWNVLRNEMSVVGPRPALPAEVLGWTDELKKRLRVKPGITGLWQVNGRSGSSFEDYERYDLYYVDNWSLLTDLGIVVKTIPAVLSGRGAY